VAVVRELCGVMAAKGAAGGFVVTSWSFTEEAVSFASGRKVTLFDGVVVLFVQIGALCSQNPWPDNYLENRSCAGVRAFRADWCAF